MLVFEMAMMMEVTAMVGRFCLRSAKTAIAFAAALCVLLGSACSTGASSASSAVTTGSSLAASSVSTSAASAQGPTEEPSGSAATSASATNEAPEEATDQQAEQPAPEAAEPEVETVSEPDEPEADPAAEAVDSRYIGRWTGYDVYTMQDVESTYVLRDNGDWATLNVNADGTASFAGNVAGAYMSLDNLHLEEGSVEYLLCEEDGALVGSLGYEQSGTTDWLILSIPDDEVGMVCYTFFINN